jgi:hypothetical protein
MRSNGLTASAYTPVADLNPAVAEALLDELRELGVAAYSQPIEKSSVAGFARPEFTVEVLVRLYVDASASDRVVTMLSAKDPHLIEENDDLAWAQIVAGYDVPAAAAVAPWPVYEDVDLGVAEESDAGPAPYAGGSKDESDWPANGVRRKSRYGDSEEDRFVPPTPPPLPRLSGADKLSWLGLIGGPIVLVIAALFSLALPTWVMLAAALGFIAGFVSLVVRMDNGQDLDDPDNGAQV